MIKKNNLIEFLEIVFLLLFLAFSIIAIPKYLTKINPFKINEIIILGNNFLDTNRIEDKIKGSLNNNTILNINISDIKNILINNQFIKDAKIYNELPSKLIVEIKEINPIAILEKNDTIYFMNQNLFLTKADLNSLNHYINIPIITNLTNNNLDLKSTHQIISEIYNNANNIYIELNELRFKNNNILLIIVKNTEVIINNNNYEKNLKKLFGFNNQVIKKNNISIDKAYQKINLTIPKQIIIQEKELKI